VPLLPDSSKGRGQTKCSPWSSKLGFGRGANDRIPEKFTVKKHPHTHKHEGGQDAHRIVAPIKNKNDSVKIMLVLYLYVQNA
jgi:hypothetical protein